MIDHLKIFIFLLRFLMKVLLQTDDITINVNNYDTDTF